MDKSVHHQLLEKIRQYRMPDRAAELLNKHKPLIITGATASGKNSVVKHLETDGKWRHVITHTTRKPRPGEHSGKNYWFVTEQQMQRLMDSNALIEANVVHEDTVYGTSIAAYEKVVREGLNPTLVIDVQGLKDLVKRLPKLRAKFILPPNFETWLEWLNKRGAMSSVERHRRFHSARQEIEQAINEPHFTFVINHDIASVSKEIVSESVNPMAQKQAQELAKRLLEQLQQY